MLNSTRQFVCSGRSTCPVPLQKHITIPYKNWNAYKKLNITHRSKLSYLNSNPNTKIYYKERNKNNIDDLTRLNYHHQVMTYDKSVIILYYLETCKHCSRILEILNTIKENYPEYIIKKINYKLHPISPPNMSITHVPTVLLFQKNNKHKPILFKNNYTYQNYLTFIQNYWI